MTNRTKYGRKLFTFGMSVVMAAGLMAGCGAFKDSPERYESTEPQKVSTAADSWRQSFVGETVDGQKVDAGIFSDFDLTMVNVWTTWCGSCIGEMPDLADMYQNLPTGVNFISVCLDGDTEREQMKTVLEKSGAEFKTVVGNDALRDGLFKEIMAFPSTIFIDREGNMVGSIVEGAYGKDEYLEMIHTRLKEK